MHGEYLKCIIFFMVVPIKVLFILSPLAFDRLCSNVNFCCMTVVPEVIKETVTTK